MPLIDYMLLTPLDEEWRNVTDVLCPGKAGPLEKAINAITYSLWTEPVSVKDGVDSEYLVVGAPMSRRTPGQAYASSFATRTLSD
jgi:hypothetical protein